MKKIGLPIIAAALVVGYALQGPPDRYGRTRNAGTSREPMDSL